MNSYEKKYKEALEKAKDMLSNKEVRREDMKYLFPELHEDEDKVYKRAIRQMYSFLPNKPTYIGDVRVEDIFAWLAKQGSKHLDEQPRYNIGDILCDKLCTTLNKDAQPNMEIVDIRNGIYICDKGSFPVSQQDEYVLVGKRIDTKLNDDSVSNELRTASTAHAEKELKNQTFPDNLEFELIYTFEEGAKWNAAQKSTWSEKHIADVFEKVGLAKIVREQSNDALTITLQDAMIELSKTIPQPKQEWSEEDESMLFNVINRIEQLDHYWNKPTDEKLIDWLTYLKDRYTWKPSDAQMIALNDVITNGKLSNANERILKGLQEQLKKLK